MTQYTTTAHSDIVGGGWIDRMPAWTRPYVRLARLDRPIGIWLLLLPCLWSIALASPSVAVGIGIATLFAIGAVVMRGAGCVVNDIVDRNIDAKVARTAMRPLPAGEIGLIGALLFLVVLLALGLAVLVQLDRLAIGLGVASLLLVGLYPLMKRLTWWPQAFLGLTFNWGVIMGWAAVTEPPRIALPALALYAAGICWTLVYDTIYAHQDARDDEAAGVRSTARRFGDWSRLVLFGFALAMVGLLALAGWMAGLGEVYLFMLIPIGLHLAWLLLFWRRHDPGDCLMRFRASRWTGVLVLAAIVAGRLFP
jgi:4-hydroxybenzoate polyprenyltransferase